MVAGRLGDFDTTRKSFLPTVDPGGSVTVADPTAHATYTGWNYGAYVEGGWDFPVNNFRVTPFVGLGYLHQKLDDFTETGAGLADLGVSGDANSLQTSLGVRASTKFQAGNGWLVPEVRA